MGAWRKSLILLCVLAGSAAGAAERMGPPLPRTGTDAICYWLSAAARAHGLPLDYFARLLWKESRFDIKAVSPKGAQGIAQFMPATARIRGLRDPFEPEQAIWASAAFLADLRRAYGNWGLAAAAYNAGGGRVERLLRDGSRLPRETRDYVYSITGQPATWFTEPGREVASRPLEEGKSFEESCRRLPIIATRAFAPSASAGWQPWGAQVAGSMRSSGAARQAFARVKRRFRPLLNDKAPMVLRKRLGGRRFYAAMIGAGSRQEARLLCTRLRRAGGYCVVRRN